MATRVAAAGTRRALLCRPLTQGSLTTRSTLSLHDTDRESARSTPRPSHNKSARLALREARVEDPYLPLLLRNLLEKLLKQVRLRARAKARDELLGRHAPAVRAEKGAELLQQTGGDVRGVPEGGGLSATRHYKTGRSTR